MADPEDSTFFERVGNIFTTRSTGGGGRSLDEIEAAVAGEEEESGKRDFVPNLPRRATLARYNEPDFQYGGGRPRYFAGDEALPHGLPPHNIAALQRMMVEAGVLDNPRWGLWDEKSQTAYRQILGEANRSGSDVETLLTSYVEAAALGEQEARGPYVPSEPLTLRTTNKKDLAKLFRDASAQLLGVGWTDKQIRELVDAYGWEEIRVQADAYSQNVARERQLYETGTTDITQINMVEPPSPETFAENEARRRDLGGFQATQVAEDYAPAFLEALGGYT